MKTRKKLIPLQALPVIRTAPNQAKGEYRGGIGIAPQATDEELFSISADCDDTYNW